MFFCKITEEKFPIIFLISIFVVSLQPEINHYTRFTKLYKVTTK